MQGVGWNGGGELGIWMMGGDLRGGGGGDGRIFS